MEGKKAVRGALKRMGDRPSNQLSVKAYGAREKSNLWGNWPDWSDSPDFPNWEDIG
ncbi:MAG: hypothetical protein KKF67_01180 [Nanoarchaeota archaeon]|nr:hypothetical protein [Nanoarchaeota archaeon]